MEYSKAPDSTWPVHRLGHEASGGKGAWLRPSVSQQRHLLQNPAVLALGHELSTGHELFPQGVLCPTGLKWAFP